MNTALSSLTPALSVSVGSVGAMGVNYGPVPPPHHSPVRSTTLDTEIQSSLEATTIVPSSPELTISSPKTPIESINNNIPSDQSQIVGEDSLQTQEYDRNELMSRASLVNSQVSLIERESTTPPSPYRGQQLNNNSSTTPPPVISHGVQLSTPIRRSSTPPRTMAHYQSLPMTPTTTPPVTDITHLSPTTLLPQFMSHRMLQSWHAHVYGPPIKSPTSHTIVAILGDSKPIDYASHGEHIRITDEPLNLTTRPPLDYREGVSKGECRQYYIDEKVMLLIIAH